MYFQRNQKILLASPTPHLLTQMQNETLFAQINYYPLELTDFKEREMLTMIVRQDHRNDKHTAKGRKLTSILVSMGKEMVPLAYHNTTRSTPKTFLYIFQRYIRNKCLMSEMYFFF